MISWWLVGSQSKWIRIGLVLIHWTRSKPYFSERHGYKRFYPIGFGWRIRISVE